jgi:hypothetical protein
MNKSVVRGLIAAAGLAGTLGLSGAASAQAPATAQIWDVRFVVDTSGPFAAGASATAVGITMVARVAILPNSSASGTRNFGVSRVGGGNGTFFASVNDPAAGVGTAQLTQGPTGQTDGMGNPLLDVNGNPLRGHFAAFRASFTPGTAPFLGDNNDPSNGISTTIAGGDAAMTSIVGSRAFQYDGTPLGVATGTTLANLTGSFASVYRFLYIPKVGPNNRLVTLGTQGLSVRYLHTVSGTNATAGAAIGLNVGDITFRVPTPGAVALLGLGGLAAARRRRA